ncbi:hypothetical protein BUQ74_19440 [Leptospira weilii serovar Heyan]|nr:hypothetical protein BUQ74_19440 [Leptospira weilii serovar Heyan]
MICSLRVAHHPKIRGNSGTTLPKGRVVGPIVSQRICRNSDRFIFGSKYLWVGYVREKHFSFLFAQTFLRPCSR